MTEDDNVEWVAPVPGTWLRTFRLGEWLPAPLTPLFETWLLDHLETACFKAMVTAGRPVHITVNGWYYHSPTGASGVRQWLAMARRPFKLILNFGLVLRRPDLTERWSIAPTRRRWEQDLLPRYRSLVKRGAVRLDHADSAEIVSIVDSLATAAGEYFASITQVAGFAWKAEWSLARFCNRHLADLIDGNCQPLLIEPEAVRLTTNAHAVFSLDWIYPTLGETEAGDVTAPNRHSPAAYRDADIARRTLPKRLRRRFDRHVAVARRAARYREQQVADFTLAWPLLRRYVLRLGNDLADVGVIDDPSDVFFLTRDELEQAINGSSDRRATQVESRRSAWQRQQLLSPPPWLGTPPATDRILRDMQPARASKPAATLLRGLGVSPGAATGPVRVIRTPDRLHRVQVGDVLVAPLTTPAWTPAMSLAAAVITEGGTLLAHAALTARELGIPAIAGATDATTLLHDGQLVTVDGITGTVCASLETLRSLPSDTQTLGP